MKQRLDRRRFIAAVGAGSLALAGCTDQVPGTNDGNGSNDDGNGSNGDGSSGDVTPPAIDHGEVVDDFGDLDQWYVLGDGTANADEDESLTGTQAVRMENEGTVAGIGRAYPDGLDISGHDLSLAVRVDTPRPARIALRIDAPRRSDQLTAVRTVVGSYEGWLRMDAGYTDQVGEPNLENVQEIAISLQTQDDQEIRFWIDDFRMTPAADQGYVMLTFDDGVESQYTNGFPMFEERDMQGVLCVIPNSLNRAGRLDIDHLREMRDAGWDVSAQAQRSNGLAEMDPEEARQALEEDHEYLDSRGFPDGARFHAVPYHNVDQEVVDIAREYYELNSYFGGNINAVPPTDPMHMSRLDMHDLDGFTHMIDMAAEHNQLAVGLAHGVGDGELDDITEDELEQLLDYIENADVELITASDLLDNV